MPSAVVGVDRSTTSPLLSSTVDLGLAGVGAAEDDRLVAVGDVLGLEVAGAVELSSASSS